MDTTTQEIQNIFLKQEKICLYGVTICVSVWLLIAVILKVTGASQQIIDICVMPGVIAVGLALCMVYNELLRNKIMSKLIKEENIQNG